MPEIERVVDLMLDELRHRLAERQITVRVTDAARRHIAGTGFDPVFGARPLRRYIQREVETRIGRAPVEGDVHHGATILLDLDDTGELAVTWSSAPATPEPVTA